MQAKVGYNDLVFINCPFDKVYMPLLHATIFSIYRCGFAPKCALAEDNGTDYRLEKIIKCIEECKYGIHDISRVEVSDSGLPRFNMPFELGVFFGAKRFGTKDHKNKNAIVFEKEKFSYQQYISDLSGIDTKAHNNKPDVLIKEIRNWLATSSRRKSIPGHLIIQRDYLEFTKKLPAIIAALGLDITDTPFNDFCQIVEEAMIEIIKK